MMNTSASDAYKISIAAGLLCLLVYSRALSGEFVNWDDPHYIVDNPAIRILDWQFIREALTTSYMGWWMPLTWISFAIDYQFWGLNPFGYRLTNILIHAANTGLVVLIADSLLGHGARVPGLLLKGREHTGVPDDNVLTGAYRYPALLMLAGLLWGLHPLRVESVAWATERKDVLNGLFSLGSILCYLRYSELREVAGQTRVAVWSYIFSLLLLLLSLMSKPVSVVIPAMLLVVDWYPLNRFQKNKLFPVLLEKLPFLMLVVTVSLATIHLAAGNQILVSYSDLSLFDRILLAGNSLFEYCRLSLYPVNIVHMYLLPRAFPLSYTVNTVVMLVFTCVCVWKIKKYPWLFATWLLFVLPLLPVLGFFQNGSQSHAARFTYLPALMPSICVAVVILVAAGKSSVARSRFTGIFCACLVMFPLFSYGVITARLIDSWKNSEALWSRIIAIQPIGRAYYLRADYYLQKGRYLDAANDLQTSIFMGEKAGFPEVFNLHALRGDALSKVGRYQEAVQELSAAIRLYPHPNYFYHRGVALKQLGQTQSSEEDLTRAGTDTGPIEWQNFKPLQ